MTNPKKAAIKIIAERLEAEMEDLQAYQKSILRAAHKETTADNRQENREEEMVRNLSYKSEAIDELAESIEHLRALDGTATAEIVDYGSLVETNHGRYLVCVASPMLNFEGKSLIGISKASPFYQEMDQLKKGDSFSVNELDHEILHVW